MPASGKAPADAEAREPALTEAQRKIQIRLINTHQMLNITLTMFTWNSRSEVLAQLVGGDASRMASIMATYASATGLFEFMLNPTVGSLSDTYGRRRFMMLSPLCSMVLKLWAGLNPSIFSLGVEKVVCDALRTISGTTMCGTALSDLCSGKELNYAMGNLLSSAGMAAIFSPLLVTRIAAAAGSASATYVAGAAAGGALFALECLALQETLPLSRRKPFKGVVNPFAFVKLFRSGKRLAELMRLCVMQWFVEFKNLADINTVYQFDVLKWESAMMNRYSSFVGVGFVLGGQIGNLSLKTLGARLHTSMAHVASVLAFTLRALMPVDWAMWTSTAMLGFYGDARNGAIKGMAVKAAVEECGMGKGEFSGLSANCRAAIVTVAPLVYGRFYKLFGQGAGGRQGTPGKVFLVAAVLSVLGELNSRTVKI